MDIMDVLLTRPSLSVVEPHGERAAYLEPDGSVSEELGTTATTGGARNDVALTAGAIAVFALAGLVAMRYAFKGALP